MSAPPDKLSSVMHSPATAFSAIIEDQISLAAIAALRKSMLRRVIGDDCTGLGYIAAMNEQNGDSESASENEDEIQALASRFVDLWQRQLEIMADDPALRGMMAAFTGFAPPASQTGGAFDQNGTSDDSQDSATSGKSATSETADGAAPAGSSSRQRGDQLDELTRRLAACEERLAALEKGAQGGSGSARKRPRKTKP
jgi:hypothetical protein